MRSLAITLALFAASTSHWSATNAKSPPLAAEASPSASAEQRLAHISVITVGHGSPVVLIPGLASPRAVWDEMVPALARNHKVCRTISMRTYSSGSSTR